MPDKHCYGVSRPVPTTDCIQSLSLILVKEGALPTWLLDTTYMEASPFSFPPVTGVNIVALQETTMSFSTKYSIGSMEYLGY